jgi:hypothetical protein
MEYGRGESEAVGAPAREIEDIRIQIPKNLNKTGFNSRKSWYNA